MTVADRDRSPPRTGERGQKYLDSEASLSEIISHLPAEERKEWDSYGHLRVEPSFQDRVFVLYQAQGRDNRGDWAAPKIITTVRVISFVAKDDTGCVVRLARDDTGEETELTHVPRKIFGFPIFMAVPPLFTLRWDAREHAGKTLRSLSYLLFVKTRNRSDFYSKSNYYLETPNRLRLLYPHADLNLEL